MAPLGLTGERYIFHWQGFEPGPPAQEAQDEPPQLWHGAPYITVASAHTGERDGSLWHLFMQHECLTNAGEDLIMHENNISVQRDVRGSGEEARTG